MSEIITRSHGDTALKDVDLGKKMIGYLEKHYPNHAFYVECNHDAGVLSIQLLYEEKNGVMRRWAWGMLIHLKNLMSDAEIDRRAMTDGGELLERYRIARTKAHEETRQRAKENTVATENVAHEAEWKNFNKVQQESLQAQLEALYRAQTTVVH